MPAPKDLHALEGVCTCTGPGRNPDWATPSVHCGLSAHRVQAARARVTARELTEKTHAN